MMLCLLPVTLTLAALAADVGDAVADKRFRLRPVDPLTRRSTMDKNFMRLGRAFDCWTSPEDVAAAATAKRVDPAAMAIGRRDSNFMRFGRGEVYTPGDNKIPRRHYDVDVDGLEVRFGRSAGPAADRGAPSAYDRRRRRRRR